MNTTFHRVPVLDLLTEWFRTLEPEQLLQQVRESIHTNPPSGNHGGTLAARWNTFPACIESRLHAVSPSVAGAIGAARESGADVGGASLRRSAGTLGSYAGGGQSIIAQPSDLLHPTNFVGERPQATDGGMQRPDAVAKTTRRQVTTAATTFIRVDSQKSKVASYAPVVAYAWPSLCGGMTARIPLLLTNEQDADAVAEKPTSKKSRSAPCRRNISRN